MDDPIRSATSSELGPEDVAHVIRGARRLRVTTPHGSYVFVVVDASLYPNGVAVLTVEQVP